MPESVGDSEPMFPFDDEQVERLAECLASIYRFAYYLGPLPCQAHRDHARRILSDVWMNQGAIARAR